jgi:hypothetical protein
MGVRWASAAGFEAERIQIRFWRYRVRTKLAGSLSGSPMLVGPVHWSVIVPVNWSATTVPASATAQSAGRVSRINDAETAVSDTLPLIEPPDVPSQVKLPASDEPLCVMFIVILQPARIGSHPVRFHVPETSTGRTRRCIRLAP